MNIILAESHEVADSRLTLTDHRAKHIVKVLQAELGDQLRVGLVDGKMGYGTLVTINKKYPYVVVLDLVLSEPSRLPPPIDLILALPRPIMLKRILSQVTALGVGTIHLIHANRVEKSFWEAGILQPEEFRRHLLHGLEQAVDTRVPEIHLHRHFRPFIEDFFPPLAAGYDHLLLAHPSGNLRLSSMINGNSGRIALAVGPEGGWVEHEVTQFQQRGFSCCTIGARILKVDTAVVALHARISALREVMPGAAAGQAVER